MIKNAKFFALFLCANLLLGCTTTATSNSDNLRLTPLLSDQATIQPSAQRQQLIQPTTGFLKVATWNVEHLAFPINTGCRPRTPEEVEKLKTYAQSLNADIIGLQEVASAEAVSEIFPTDDWQVIMSPRQDSRSYNCRESGYQSTQQKVAFVVKKPIQVENVQAIEDLGLDSPGLRYGLEIQVVTDLGVVSLLNVHLKSGCFVDNYRRGEKDACSVLAKQAPILDNWVEQKEQLGLPYLVLGDFNHRLTAPYNQLTQELMSSDDGKQRSIVNTGANLIGCHPYYPAPIDQIFVGQVENSSIEYQAKVHHFEDMRVDSMLSDHCALSATLSKKQLPVTNSVKWLTKSKEYPLITRSIYKLAEARLSELTLPNTPWAVVMDVDETVLDNSPYQVMLDQSGNAYTQKTWTSWIELRQASLVPGAEKFIKKVFSLGGKVALITNRDKSRDEATWNNLSKLLPITPTNTCLTGRTLIDKESVNGQDLVNDKDLRRQQLVDGSIDCFSDHNDSNIWQSGHIIIMQIGDNIEDVGGVTQHSAGIDELIERANSNIFILPNPMYGSW
ncbi:HAD family acid phosphatase [Paraglaciecola arctica]|uniref:HAD family acid phosphatase n=1 Tax=Paraglaciecola arctica TaxID=1128911 RepID=UPI001C067303|nr:HAD family acid phosphatase [Paraglaciecola arctica]MBU3004611.1 endonuclease/exonuclease/phosphatase family protein [Paraglaciecola arctica]